MKRRSVSPGARFISKGTYMGAPFAKPGGG